MKTILQIHYDNNFLTDFENQLWQQFWRSTMTTIFTILKISFDNNFENPLWQDFWKLTSRFELPLNMSSLCGLGPVDFLSRFKSPFYLFIFLFGYNFKCGKWRMSKNWKLPFSPLSASISINRSTQIVVEYHSQACDSKLEQATAVRQSLLQVNSRNLGYAAGKQ